MHELPPRDSDLGSRLTEETEEDKKRTQERIKAAAKDIEQLDRSEQDEPEGVTDTGVSCPHGCADGTIQRAVSYSSDSGDIMLRPIGTKIPRAKHIAFWCSKCKTLFQGLPE